MKFRYLTFLILVFIGCKSDEQINSVQIESNVDTTLARIGDIINFNVISHFAEDKIINFPDIHENESMEVRSKAIFEKNNKPKNVKFEIVFWDTGSFYIPQYPVQFLNADSSLDFTINTDSIHIEVISMLTGVDDISLRPLKDPVAIKEPIDWHRMLLITILIILTMILIGLWRRRIKKPELKKISVKENQSAKDIAMSRFAELKKIIKIDCKTFYLHTSFLIREFIENQFYIRALEMTTKEIKVFESEMNLSDNQFIEVMDILNRADLAKFAKYEFLASERQKDFDWLFNFISNYQDQ